MPEMDGWEFRIEQKREPAWASIPIVALSGDHSAKAEAIDAARFARRALLRLIDQTLAAAAPKIRHVVHS